MRSQTEIVPVVMPNGKTLHVRATVLGGEEDVAFGSLSFDGVTDAIQGIAQAITGTLEQVKPRKASVEFGLEIATESGQLTALLVNGSSTATLKVTLEWGQ